MGWGGCLPSYLIAILQDREEVGGRRAFDCKTDADQESKKVLVSEGNCCVSLLPNHTPSFDRRSPWDELRYSPACRVGTLPDAVRYCGTLSKRTACWTFHRQTQFVGFLFGFRSLRPAPHDLDRCSRFLSAAFCLAKGDVLTEDISQCPLNETLRPLDGNFSSRPHRR